MWQREQKASSSEPGRETVYLSLPMLNSDAQSLPLAKGLSADRGVPSGGCGMSQLPWVDTIFDSRKKAPRHTGSRHEFDIIDPFHSSKIFWWQFWHWPGWFAVCQNSS